MEPAVGDPSLMRRSEAVIVSPCAANRPVESGIDRRFGTDINAIGGPLREEPPGLASALVLPDSPCRPSRQRPPPQPVRMGSSLMTRSTRCRAGASTRTGSPCSGRPTAASPSTGTATSTSIPTPARLRLLARRQGAPQLPPATSTPTSHDLKSREEAGGEFIYGARNSAAEGSSSSTPWTGEIVPEAALPKGVGHWT